MNIPCYYRVSVKGTVIDKRGRLLLTRERDGRWDLLGGGLDHGENPLDGLKREIHEEAGLVVTGVSPTPCYFYTVQREGHETFIANIVYQITLKDMQFTPSDECQELCFFTVDEARKEDVRPNVVRLLEIFDPTLHGKISHLTIEH